MDERIKTALAVVEAAAETALANGPLGAMGDWIAGGRPPRSELLREAGLNGGLTATTAAEGLLFHELRMARKPFIKRWGFSIPCAEAVNALSPLAPLVEIGAGTGYWTALLTAAQCDVVATDVQASGNVGYGFDAGRHAVVEPYGAVDAVHAYGERNVLCSWPTEGATWPLEAARALRSGRSLALIGDQRGLETGTPELAEYLAIGFERLETTIIPQFPGCIDDLTIYRKI